MRKTTEANQKICCGASRIIRKMCHFDVALTNYICMSSLKRLNKYRVGLKDWPLKFSTCNWQNPTIYTAHNHSVTD